MNEEKEIARTIIEAQKMHEESYTNNKYKLEIEECLGGMIFNSGQKMFWQIETSKTKWLAAKKNETVS